MLLNSHTALRTYREAQFDLTEFLQALGKINPLDSDSSDNAIVEAKWADGSVSVVPVLQVIKDLVGEMYPTLNIQRTILEVDKKRIVVSDSASSRLVDVLLINNNIGVSLKVETLDASGSSITFKDSLIKALVADTLILDPDTPINDLNGIENISARDTTVTEKTTVRQELSTDSVNTNYLDVSNTKE